MCIIEPAKVRLRAVLFLVTQLLDGSSEIGQPPRLQKQNGNNNEQNISNTGLHWMR